MRARRVYVNEAFRPQRVSGQQRYAHEISDRLPPDYTRVAPGPFFAATSVRTWLWTLLVLPVRTWGGVLVSMTARAPWFHPRHVLVVHDLFVIDHPEWFTHVYYTTHAPLLRFQLRTAQALVAVSEPVATQVRGLRPGVTVAIAPNAPSAVFAARTEDKHGVLASLGLVSGEYFLVVGNLEPRKNLTVLAAAYGMLTPEQRQNAPLVVVGGGADIYQAADVAWPVGTRQLGYVPDAELRVLYANSRSVVFPSLAEGFGLPIVEAVSAGARALLLSDIPVFRWIVGDGATFFSPSSVGSLHAALVEHLSAVAVVPRVDPAVVARFTWEESVDHITTSIESLRRRSGRSPGRARPDVGAD